MSRKKPKKYKILAIIPARGGSKGVSRKNIKLLSGKPLIAYSIEVALKSKYIDKVVGKRTKRKIKKDETIKWKDLSEN